MVEDETEDGVTADQLTEIQRHVADLVSIAETVARTGPPGPGMARLYAEVEQLAAVLSEAAPKPPRRAPETVPPRQRGTAPQAPAPYATDYWFG